MDKENDFDKANIAITIPYNDVTLNELCHVDFLLMVKLLQLFLILN